MAGMQIVSDDEILEVKLKPTTGRPCTNRMAPLLALIPRHNYAMTLAPNTTSWQERAQQVKPIQVRTLRKFGRDDKRVSL